MAEGVAGVVATAIPLVATPPVATPLLPTTPARVLARANVASRLAEVAVAVARRAEVEAATGVVPIATVGPVLAKDHAVAHPDVVGRASGLAQVPTFQDSRPSIWFMYRSTVCLLHRSFTESEKRVRGVGP